jgi:hypothetical protein
MINTIDWSPAGFIRPKKELEEGAFYAIMPPIFKEESSADMDFVPEQIEDRRANPRAQISEAVRFERIEQHEFGGSVGFDISESGLRMRSSDYVPIGTELTLQITLPDKHIIECKGSIRWVKKEAFNDSYQVGIHFTEFENALDSRSRIQRCVGSIRT